MSWRDVFIGTLVGIILSPLSLAISYYTNRTFARPLLSVQYVNPVVDLAFLDVDKDLFTTWRRIQMASGPFSAPDASIIKCNHQFEAGSLSPACVNRLQTAIQGELNFGKSMQTGFIDDLEKVKQWNGDKKNPPNVLPISMPNFDLETELANGSKAHIMHFFTDTVSNIDKVNTTMMPLVSKLSAFASHHPNPRSGNVSFKVGILNFGDLDAVIFPDATLSFQGSHAALRAVSAIQSVPDAIPLVPQSPSPQFNVVRGHSFTEVTLVMNNPATEPSVSYAWQSLVTNGTQQEFSIDLKASAKLSPGQGRLPPQ